MHCTVTSVLGGPLAGKLELLRFCWALDLVLGAECAEQRNNLEISYPITNGIVTGKGHLTYLLGNMPFWVFCDRRMPLLYTFELIMNS
jgi:hypothetical protein